MRKLALFPLPTARKLKNKKPLILACILCFSTVACVNAHAEEGDEVSLRAAIILAMLRYTSWSERENAPLTICSYGSPVSHDKLDEAVSGANYLTDGAFYKEILKEEDLGVCDVVVIGASVEKIQNKLLFSNKFTVCDGCRGLQEESIATLRKVDRNIRFNINLSVATEAKIVLSSELLALALSVRRADDD